MPADIEPGVIRPDGVVESERSVRHSLAKAWDQAEALIDMLQQALEVRWVATHDDRRADVNVNRSSLGQKRGHVRSREPVAHTPAAAPPAPAMNSARLSRAPDRTLF